MLLVLAASAVIMVRYRRREMVVLRVHLLQGWMAPLNVHK